jgi:hypothetical protein
MAIRGFSRGVRALAVAGLALAGASCGEVARTGKSPAYLIVELMEAASGAEDNDFHTNLLSDVETLIEVTVSGQQVRVPSYFNDLGRVRFRHALKNVGLPSGSLGPSTLNDITVTRYRVVYRRADGRNTPGVDVPYSFDGAFTVTVPGSGSAEAGFDLVRHQAKLESPLRNLAGLGGALFISTIAEVTFYGHDQAGNEVSATATISIQFGDFADPD